MKLLDKVSPGQVLLHDFLKPYGLSQSQLARHIDVPARRINEIVHGKRAITPDTALRLARAFGMTPRFWLNLQARFDLDKQSEILNETLDRIELLPAVQEQLRA
ncbi:MAG: HigA family addiction module antitoxin [Aurantimicrobium sp.]|uniref:HigA family addiction module antitoxin n=1 Tax=Aurantimicrobium sp. TaxID=1930784 RepID=UPI002FC6BC0A